MKKKAWIVVRSCLFSATCLLVFAGCTTHRFGDAHIRRNADVGSISVDRLYLDAVPLGVAGTNVLRVRDLAFPLFPTHLIVPITPTESEAGDDPPWAGVQLRIEFRDLSGKTFFTRDVSLREARPGVSPGARQRLQVQFRSHEGRIWSAPEDMPRHTSYDVVVAVLEPSPNKNHRVVLYADTYVR